MSKAARDTIFVEQAEVLQHRQWPGQQFILRLQAPLCARKAAPGQFIHLRCDDGLPLRRPLSIMAVDVQTGWIDLLYKVVGEGTTRLAQKQRGDVLSLIGPIGNRFTDNHARPHKILIGGGVGIPPMLFLASQLARLQADNVKNMLLLMGSESPFPFELKNSSLTVSGIQSACKLALAGMEQLQIASRLASLSPAPGIHNGYVTELARQHFDTLDDKALAQTEIFACGPTPMLQAVGQLASEFKLPCQVSLEEVMACAVGGCAGCVVRLSTDAGESMQRVCVDGPVFEASRVCF